VKNIVRELNNEKVDIIRWSADIKEFVLEALKPAKVKSMTLDEAKKTVHIKVDEDQLSLAIGKRGQNARLTNRLTGWEISIEKDQSAKEAFENNVERGVSGLASALSVPMDQARLLMTSGMTSLDVISSVEPQDIADVLGCDLAEAERIHAAALNDSQKVAGSSR
jgi:transcription termination/antitermination protein NusA